jgi:hypothetical protein
MYYAHRKTNDTGPSFLWIIRSLSTNDFRRCRKTAWRHLVSQQNRLKKTPISEWRVIQEQAGEISREWFGKRF